MCGIVGYKKFSSNSQNFSLSLKIATDSLSLRGPDFQSTLVLGNLGFGHARLSIIDTSDNANQPMQDPSGRFTLIFNGEIYNYKQLKSQIHRVSWRSTSDTEVLLHLLIQKGTSCLEELNGFFAFAFYDSHTDRLVIARDRMGIKPLHYFQNNDFLVFGSEMKALMQFPIPREIDHKSLNWYLKLTYLPRDHSMLSGVKKLLPGHYLEFDKNRSTVKSYESPDQEKTFHGSFESAKSNTLKLLQKSVERRMVADVPLGAFLSGGTDSSAVVAMASKFDSNLNTFSIGYRDHPFFDETQYAELVAQKFKTNHTTFSLTNDDLLNSIEDSIGYLDEPFGDSSAIPTFILSKMVSTSMKVALSGDGADELFGGYYKHLAFVKAHQATIGNSILKK
ncbi:MAG: asparagine synthase (glutamine-hydrolyzing), partial [Bacteroidota bacterium]